MRTIAFTLSPPPAVQREAERSLLNMKAILYIIIGIVIGVGAMVLVDQWDTIQQKKNMFCCFGAQGKFVRAESLGSFRLSLWENDSTGGHDLFISTPDGPSQMISVHSSSLSNETSFIRFIDVELSSDCFSISSSDQTGGLKDWMFDNGNNRYSYERESGYPAMVETNKY